jgi:RNA-binding protein YlmH
MRTVRGTIEEVDAGETLLNKKQEKKKKNLTVSSQRLDMGIGMACTISPSRTADSESCRTLK